MTDLDDPEVYRRLDPSGMRTLIRDMPRQCLKAWRRALEFALPSDYSGVDRVVVLGMGGSAIGGDLLASLVEPDGRALVSVHRGYDVPHSVDSQTLLVAASYSGMTEETLSAFNEALNTPAKKLALTTGGKLKSLAEGHGVPVFTIDYKAPPRAALAHSLFPLLGFSQKLGLISGGAVAMDEMAGALELMGTELNDERPLEANPAKQLATRLSGKVAVLYAAEALSPAARRWKSQINENSKAWAFYEVLPELNHNAVVGYEFPDDLRHRVFVVMLRSPRLHPRVRARYEATADVLSHAGVEYEIVDARGDAVLAQLMSLVLYGDWVSYYLALLYGEDPSPVRVIDYLKRWLSEH